MPNPIIPKPARKDQGGNPGRVILTMLAGKPAWRIWRGFALRPKAKPKPYIEFNGSKYTVRNHGYLAKTNGDRSLLHRDIWELHNGPIPDGWDIHHKDHNKHNNSIENFECLPKSEHTKLYSPKNNQYTKGRKRGAKCGA